MYVRAQGGLAQSEDANWLKSYYIFKKVLCREMHWKWNVLGSVSIIFFLKNFLFLYLMILDILGWFRALEGLSLPQ